MSRLAIPAALLVGFVAGVICRDRAWLGLCLPRLGSEYQRMMQIGQYRRRPRYEVFSQ